jgi:hypothetical protein
MAERLAKFGWTAEAIVLHGPGDRQAQYYLVARETEAEVEAAVRRMPGIHPEDRVVVRAHLSPQSIESQRLLVDEVRLHVPSDPNQLAKSIIDIATGQQPSPMDTRDPAAVAMGKKGGKARADSLTAEQRSEIARRAAAKRWEK